MLLGFGVGPWTTVVLDHLEPAAQAVAAHACVAVGARWHLLNGATDIPGPVLRLAHLDRDPGLGPATRTLVLDRLGRVPSALDLTPPPAAARRPALSLAFFGLQVRGRERQAYTDLLDAAVLADALGFQAVWTPERHFDSFGGSFPTPSVLSAVVAQRTSRIDVRAGSVILPLAHPARVVEEWALVDNLSDGRVGVAFASGWRERDRLLAVSAERPDMDAGIDLVRRLWRGDTVELSGPGGVVDRVQVQPAPVQAELPMWLTVMNNPDSWDRAARKDLRVLTNMIGRSTENLAERIGAYQAARADAHKPPGQVTVMLFAHVEDHHGRAQQRAREPLERYLAASAVLSFGGDQLPRAGQRIAALPDEERAAEVRAMAHLSAERYLHGPSLIGDLGACRDVLDRFGELGVGEVACLVDFGPGRDEVLATVERLGALVTEGGGGRPADRPPLAAARNGARR